MVLSQAEDTHTAVIHRDYVTYQVGIDGEEIDVFVDSRGQASLWDDTVETNNLAPRRRIPHANTSGSRGDAVPTSRDGRRAKCLRSTHQTEPSRASARTGISPGLVIGGQVDSKERMPRGRPAPTQEVYPMFIIG